MGTQSPVDWIFWTAGKRTSLSLKKSKLDANSAESRGESDLHARSFGHNDLVLDTPIKIEEIENAVKKLMVGKAGGFDGIQPEHIKYGGHSLLI